MTSQQLSVKVAINSWRAVLERTDKIFSSLSEDQLLREVAPGKNRLIYLVLVERCLVLFEAKTLQPACNIHRRFLRSECC